jgi:hypothetical protein
MLRGREGGTAYTEAFITGHQLMWGEGFLSPGGAAVGS